MRWDTCRHEKDDPRRVNVLGKPYPPFHDVGIVVDGDCARALGELARERWRRATGHPPRRAPATPGSEAWPAGVEPALTDIDVAIARTEPAFNGYPAVGEIRQLHLDAIAGARRRIFAENQYFTSRLISDAFAQRLREDDAPEIAVISPFTQSGWLEISTMGVLRGRNHRLLRAADRHGRYRLYYPTLPWLDGKDDCLNIHSKVLVVDDELLMIGSANLADRSMGTDTECNLALEARGDPRVERAIAGFARSVARRASRPLAVGSCRGHRPEHSLHQGIAALSHEGRRCLKVIEPELDPKLDALVPDQQVLDPERPIDPDTIVADLVPREEARSGARGRLTGVALVVVALTAAAVAWRYTPLQAWLEPARLIELGDVAARGSPGAAYAILAFVGGGLVLFPVSVLVAVTVVLFGPIWALSTH